MPTVSELGQKVKKKYPGAYDDLSDLELGQKTKAKYPEYSDFTDEPKTGVKADYQTRVGKASEAFTRGFEGKQTTGESVFQAVGQGAGLVGDIALQGLAAVTPAFIEEPVKRIFKTGVEKAVNNPVGQGIMGAYQQLPERLRKNVEAGGNIATLFPVGAGGRLALRGAEKTIETGSKVVGRGAGEVVGATTGAGYGAVKETFNAARRGGAGSVASKEALRGTATPEQIVNEAKGALSTIYQGRTNDYVKQLETVTDNTKSYDISPIFKELDTQLKNFKVVKKPDGTLDFSRSPIRFDKSAQGDIQYMVDTMKDFGLREGDRTVVGLDSLKRAFGDLYQPSGQARAFVTAVKDRTREILKEAPGYDKLTNDYEKTTGLIKEIERGLSLTDRASTDTAFRKLTTVLRTNNEFRKQLVDELNAISGGTLVPKIAGQQMSEYLPRGVIRPIAVGGGAYFSGFSLAPLIPLLTLGSPRAVGEVVRALGLGLGKTQKVLQLLGQKSNAAATATKEATKRVFGKPRGGLSIEDVNKVSPSIFKGLPVTTTKLMEKFKGMPENITPQQFNEVINKAQKEGIKKVDLDMIRGSAKEVNGKVNLPQLAKDVETQLVPLTPTPLEFPRYSHIGEDFIGDGKYGEVVYQSPIKTSAGDVHFGGANDEVPNYFSHVRYEDLADGKTRKILETQSDLMQKENFALEQKKRYGTPGRIEKREVELNKLSNYESNDPLAQLRTFREEVKRAARDGKDTILIPSGETAMKIEGLGDDSKWYTFGNADSTIRGGVGLLTHENIKIGKEVSQRGGDALGSDKWIITDVLGDGKFKAIQKNILEEAGLNPVNLSKGDIEFLNAEGHSETFDISGKIDSKHFVYKLNEEAIPKEARKQGLIVEGKVELSPDRLSGESSRAIGSTWWKIKIPKERAKMPVEAFGVIPPAIFLTNQDKQ